MKKFEKMTMQELWTTYQKLGAENAQLSVKISENTINMHALVSWIMGRYDEKSTSL